MTLWPCTFCERPFKRKGDMVRHERTHTGIRPFVCDVCGKSFAQSCGLRNHTNIHTKNKPHECGLNSCTSRFADPSSCARHQREYHSDAAYRCPIDSCGSTIKRRSSYVAHLKKHKIDTTCFDIDSMIKSSVAEGDFILTSPVKSRGKGRGKCKEKEKGIQIPKVPYVPPPTISRPVSPLDLGLNDPFLQNVLDMNDPAMYGFAIEALLWQPNAIPSTSQNHRNVYPTNADYYNTSRQSSHAYPTYYNEAQDPRWQSYGDHYFDASTPELSTSCGSVESTLCVTPETLLYHDFVHTWVDPALYTVDLRHTLGSPQYARR